MKLISKTDYLVWRDCPHNAWVKRWKPDIYNEQPLSEFDRNLITTGNLVEEKAREYFGEGVLIEGRDEQSLKRTKECILAKTETLFQACFSDGVLFAAVDILKQGNDGELYIYEVKASNSSKLEEDYGGEDGEENEGDIIVDFRDAKAVEKYKKKLLKDQHLYDLAFQVYLARKVGYVVAKSFLVRLDKKYTRGESLNLNKLFVKEDVSNFVDEIIPIIESEVEKLIRFLNQEKDPGGPCGCIYKGRSKHCTTFKYHNEKILEDAVNYGVHDLTRIGNSKAKLKDLIDRKIYNISHIPSDIEFSKKMRRQIDVHGKDKAEVDHEAIRTELDKLQFPLYFLDYESFNPAIPRFTGYKPYQHIPFQYSLHRLDTIDAEPIHTEFFYAGQDDPAPLLASKLKKEIGNVGSVIVWNRTFEESHINKHLAERLPEYAEFLNGVNSRIFDLMTIFSKQLHIHSDFHGSASIKKVLPVICPEHSYKELEIGNGSEAMNTWNRMVTEDISVSEKRELEQSMLEYCKLDTMAMYAIWKHLINITK